MHSSHWTAAHTLRVWPAHFGSRASSVQQIKISNTSVSIVISKHSIFLQVVYFQIGDKWPLLKMMLWYQTCDNQLSKQMVIFYLNPMVSGDSQNIEVFKNKSSATDNDINAVVWN